MKDCLINCIACIPDIQIGEEFMKRDCSEYCTCEGNGDLQCHELSCAFNAQCAVKGGVRNCYCDDGFMGNGREECSVGELTDTRHLQMVLTRVCGQ